MLDPTTFRAGLAEANDYGSIRSLRAAFAEFEEVNGHRPRVCVLSVEGGKRFYSDACIVVNGNIPKYAPAPLEGYIGGLDGVEVRASVIVGYGLMEVS